MTTQPVRLGLENAILPDLKVGEFLEDWLVRHTQENIESDGDWSYEEHLGRRSEPRFNGGLVEFNFKVDVVAFVKGDIPGAFTGRDEETGILFWGELTNLSEEYVATFAVREFRINDIRR